MKFFLAPIMLKHFRLLSAACLLYCGVFPTACNADVDSNIALPSRLKNGLESGGWFILHRAVQESVVYAIDNNDRIRLLMKTIMSLENESAKTIAFLELSRAGSRMVPMLIDELTSLKTASDMEPLLWGLGRLGPDAKPAIPVLTNLLNDANVDEVYKITIRVVLANTGYQSPGLMEQICSDLITTNRTPVRPLAGIALNVMAYTHVRDWINDAVISQMMKPIRIRPSDSTLVAVTLGSSGKGRSTAIHALRELNESYRAQSSWDCFPAVIGFARYLIETKGREECLRDSLRYIGSKIIGGEQYGVLSSLSYSIIDDAVVQQVIECLNDKDEFVRVGAIRTLAGVGLPGKKAIPKLFDLAKKGVSEDEKESAFIAIGTMAEADRIPELEQCLQREQNPIIKSAIEHSLKLIRHEYPTKRE